MQTLFFVSPPSSWTWWEWVLFLSTILYWAYWAWNFAIAVMGGLKPPRRYPPAKPTYRFAVLVAAHNEEAVIGHLLDSLLAQRYPCHLFRVFVIADNCTDRTADIARSRGATVLERKDLEHPGKTQAIRWALPQIPREEFDAVAFFDADNLVDHGFLRAMNNCLVATGAEAVQGYLDVKNPDDSWVTKVYAVAYWYTNRFWQAARDRVGLSATLEGTGSVIRLDCIDRIGWNLESLTEDLEFATLLVLRGRRVRWCEKAVVYDEKPVSLQASRRQRTRWMQGHYHVCFTMLPRLLSTVWNRPLAQTIDLTLYLLIPGRNALNYLALGGSIVVLVVLMLDHAGRLDAIVFLWAVPAVVQAAFVVVVGPSVRYGRVTTRYLSTVPHLLWYGLTLAPMTFYAAFTHNNKQWVHTIHTRSLSLSEVPGAGTVGGRTMQAG